MIKRIKVIWRTTNIRFMFSSKNSPFSKKVWKRLYCLRNTREHLPCVLGVDMRSSCLLLSIVCVSHTVSWLPLEWVAAGILALWLSSPHRWLRMVLLLMGLLLIPCSLQPCVLLQEQLGHPCSEASWFVLSSRPMSWPCFWEENSEKGFFFIFLQKKMEMQTVYCRTSYPVVH